MAHNDHEDECPSCGLERRNFDNAESFKNHIQTCFEHTTVTKVAG